LNGSHHSHRRLRPGCWPLFDKKSRINFYFLSFSWWFFFFFPFTELLVMARSWKRDWISISDTKGHELIYSQLV
jgi:hypothetical protein